jgi:hypothetical protein
MLPNPGEDGSRGGLLAELFDDGLRPDHTRVERLENLHGVYRHEIVDGTGIGNDNHAGCPAFCFSRNSRILARSFSNSSMV